MTMENRLDTVIIKVASACNLNCTYCYVYNHEDQGWRSRPKFVDDAVFDRTLTAIEKYCMLRDGHRINLLFHGGEPTLIGTARFDRLATRAREVLGERLGGMTMQTNATLLNDEWMEVFRRHDIHVGVSMDGPPEAHDARRVDHRGRGSSSRVVAGVELLQDSGLDPGLLCVIDPNASGVDAYGYFRSLGFKRMDFLFPDCSHDSKDRLYGQCGPTPVADYLIPVFDTWFAEDDPTVLITCLWSLLRRLLGGPGLTDSFGNAPKAYVIVETDGSIETLDALRVCKSGISVSGLNILRHDFDDLRTGLPLVHQVMTEGIPLCTTCRRCPEREVCAGGYLPHRYATHNEFDNPSVWCADIKKLLSHMRAAIGPAMPATKTRTPRRRETIPA
jgi:uncharacterized protein